jgi:hypothetical protein
MRKEVALMELLLEFFPTPERLRRFLYFLPAGTFTVSNLPEGGSTRRLALEAVDELRRRGLIDADFFERLKEERPQYAERIGQLQSEWLVDINSWSEPPSPEMEPHRPVGPPTVFVSYSRRDADFFEEFSTHLKVLQRKGVIEHWDEGRIRAGNEWDRVIQDQIEKAKIIIPLVSADFLSSDFTWEHGFSEALDRHKRGLATVIPIIVRPCAWQQTPIAELQVLPLNGETVAQAPNTDRVWIDIAKHVSEVAKKWRRTE